MPGGPERTHRAGVESIVSSSRFRLRGTAAWVGASSDATFSAIDWDADRNLLAFGTVDGALGVMASGLDSASGGGDRTRRGFSPLRGGGVPQEEEEVSVWGKAAGSWAGGQVGSVLVYLYTINCAVFFLYFGSEGGGVSRARWLAGQNA